MTFNKKTKHAIHKKKRKTKTKRTKKLEKEEEGRSAATQTPQQTRLEPTTEASHAPPSLEPSRNENEQSIETKEDNITTKEQEQSSQQETYNANDNKDDNEESLIWEQQERRIAAKRRWNPEDEFMDESKPSKQQHKKEHDFPLRDCSQLWVSSTTYQCALYGPHASKTELFLDEDNHHLPNTTFRTKCCIPCAYKVACFDVALDHTLTHQVPNQRPETCPRLSHSPSSSSATPPQSPQTWFQPGMQILTVGDGDLSFSLALARQLLVPPVSADTTQDGDKDPPKPFPMTRIVATVYESKETLLRVYPNFEEIVQELEGYDHVRIVYQVDATRLQAHKKELLSASNSDPTSKRRSFDCIVWNFPCTAVASGQDGQNQELEENKHLISAFVQQLCTDHDDENEPCLLNSHTGHVVMNHKTKVGFVLYQTKAK